MKNIVVILTVSKVLREYSLNLLSIQSAEEHRNKRHRNQPYCDGNFECSKLSPMNANLALLRVPKLSLRVVSFMTNTAYQVEEKTNQSH